MASRSPNAVTRSVPIAAASVKIDGIRTVEQALVAVEAGAELIGMIFAAARRQVTVDTARLISDAIRAASPEVRVVGVFVDAPAEAINEIARSAGLDLIQLHGDEPPELLAGLDLRVIKAFRALPDEGAGALTDRIRPYLNAVVPPVAVLIDGYHPEEHGGTGIRADWDIVREVSDRLGLAIGLAGGLTPDNVEAAIGQVRPAFVDVSSGVERDGIKDEALIRSFVQQADRAFQTGIR